MYAPAPWTGPRIALSADTRRHLERVLRRRPGDPVSYTDGEGVVGSGVYEEGAVVRGREESVPAAGRRVTIAAAPPHSTDRARFLVEKLAELGVDRLVWIDTAHGQAGPPRAEKARAWAIAALQQSRGSRLMSIEGPRPAGETWPGGAAVFVADPDGAPLVGSLDDAADVVVLIGPEGGFVAGEAPDDAVAVSVGDRVLRVETAAVAVAVLCLTTGGG